MASLIGKEIGKYRITERIGRGGMADVYRGIHTHLDRPVAVKVLHGHLMEGGDFIERFKREAKAVANLRHPNIVQVHDFDIQGDLIFMVMEYIDGTNLQQKLVELDKTGERLPITQIASIVSDIAAALDYAHSQGMLHRDVKPSNIMLDAEGKAYLTDFGIAKIVGDNKLTATGTLIGTPAYMSPEQGRGEELTEESDIYSLGVVAFEMLTGHVPYDAKTPIGIVHKQISEPVPRITELVDGVPVSAQEVIDRALAKTPEGRFSSADELTGALRLALEALEATEDVLVQPTIEMSAAEHDKLSAPTVTMEAGQSEPEPEAEKEKTPAVPSGSGKLSTGAWVGIGAGVLVVAALLLTFVFDVIPLGRDKIQPSYSVAGEQAFELGMNYFSVGDFDSALEAFDEAMGSGFLSADLCYHRGIANLELGDFNGADDDFSCAIEIEPENPEFWKQRGMLRMNHDNPEEALEDLSRAIELNPEPDPQAYNMRGLAFMILGDFQACVEDYSVSLEFEPENPWYAVERGDCFREMGDIGNTLEDYQRFLAYSKGDPAFIERREEVQNWMDEN